MFVPKDLYTVPQVMAATGYRAEEVLQWGATGDVFFVVMAMNATGQLGPCKVTPAALMHFVAGAEIYMVDAIPEVYSGDMFGPWKIERDKLLIVAKSWDAFHYDDRNSPPVFTRTARPTEDIPLPVQPAASSVSDERVSCEVQAAPGPELLLKRHLEGVKMFAPSMLNMADVMADSGYTEEAIFDCGISGQIVFLVVVPVIGACRVPVEALSHFMAGDDDYIAEGMPEHWSGALSDKWTIKRDRLRILGSSWNIFSDDCDKLAEAWAAATLAPSIADGLDLPLAEQYKRNARDSIAKGRCTLHEAAEILCIEAGEDNCVILSKLEAAAKSGVLPVFDRGRNARNEYGDGARVRVFGTEARCTDLDKWLDAYEPDIKYRFLVPLVEAPEHQIKPAVTAALTTVHSTKARRDALTPVIEFAKEQCRNAQDTAEVWGALLVLAEKKHGPLIGATEDGVQYLKGGDAAIFKRDALRKRLAR